MGKLSSVIVTLVFVGAIALLVYFCFRAKQKRNLGLGGHRWSDVFFRQNQDQQCNGNQIGNQNQSQGQCQGYLGNRMDGYPHQSNVQSQYPHVPHSVVSPYAQPYPGQHGYPMSGPGPVHNTPYPIGHPPNMPMPGGGAQFEHAHHVQSQAPATSYPYPPGQTYRQPEPDDLPPPYSAVVASDQHHGQRY